jgi:hypothetical protein
MSASIRFEQRGMATLIEMVDDSATLRCDFSAPPGAPITGLLLSSNQMIQLKVRDCRRAPQHPDQFVLRGRWVNLSRAARESLLGSLADE